MRLGHSCFLCSTSCLGLHNSEIHSFFIPKLGGRGYRPISLTSSVCKWFERLVHQRLEHQSEHFNGILNFQLGSGGAYLL